MVSPQFTSLKALSLYMEIKAERCTKAHVCKAVHEEATGQVVCGAILAVLHIT